MSNPTFADGPPIEASSSQELNSPNQGNISQQVSDMTNGLLGVIDNISSSKESLSTSNNQNENEIECKSALNQNSNQIENKSSENLERNENSNFASDDGIKLQDPVGAPPDISPPPQNNSELRELDNNNNSNNSGQNLNDYQFATSPEKIDIKITTENEEKADISSQESYERNKNENRDDNEDDNINENKDENRDDNEDDNINENRDENINNDDENINNNENSENKMMNAHGNEHHKKPKEDSPRTQFRKMFYGTNNPNQRRAKTSFKPRRHFTDDVTVSQETVEKMADGILKGKSCKMTNPFDVAEVIDELNSRRIDALANNDYRQSKNIKDSIDNIRSNFRQRDRELLHKEIVSKLEVRNQESIEILEETKEKWKTKRQELSREQKDALMELQDRHEIEHRQLEKEWSQPHVLRKFSKRSPNMLQNLQKEKYMLLIGEYEGAEQMKKINAQLEKAETLDRKQEMMNSFLAAQSNLISRQKSELTRLISEQTKKLDLLNEFERKDIEVKVKRLTVTQSFLDEEKDFNKFVAKKYKRPASCIVPNTVMASRDAPQDLPPLPRGKLVPHTVSDLLAVRKRAIVTPLPLPPFAVRKYKIQRVRASQ